MNTTSDDQDGSVMTLVVRSLIGCFVTLFEDAIEEKISLSDLRDKGMELISDVMENSPEAWEHGCLPEVIYDAHRLLDNLHARVLYNS